MSGEAEGNAGADETEVAVCFWLFSLVLSLPCNLDVNATISFISLSLSLFVLQQWQRHQDDRVVGTLGPA